MQQLNKVDPRYFRSSVKHKAYDTFRREYSPFKPAKELYKKDEFGKDIDPVLMKLLLTRGFIPKETMQKKSNSKKKKKKKKKSSKKVKFGEKTSYLNKKYKKSVMDKFNNL